MKGIKKYSLLVLLISIMVTASAQNWIGMRIDSIVYKMRDNEPQYALDRNAINNTYKYLKYVDDINECTKLYFYSANRCTLVRLMCSYSNIMDVTNELNSKYKTISKNNWYYMSKGKKYLVTLEEGDWFFTVTTKKSE